MSIITIGIDLAKNVFAVHGVNESGRPVLVKPWVAWFDEVDLPLKRITFIIASLYEANKAGK